MPAQDTSPKLVQFGVFELDLDRAELRKLGVKIKLQEQPLKILQLLLETPGQIVSREQLRARVWPANTFVEFDKGLYSAMARLRDTLGDNSESPRFIETVARRGYRFIAPVMVPETGSPTFRSLGESPESRLPSSDATPLAGTRLAASLFAGLLGGALLLAIILGLNMGGAREWLHSRTHPIQSVAVLPLTNVSSDADQDYFADGMTEALITDLGKIGSLRVISRTSVMQYKGTKKPLPEIARELNVDALIEGSVSRSGNHLRITANLLQASPEKHLWAESYDCEVGDALTVQGQLAQAVAHEIQVTLTPNERNLLAARRSVNPEAQDLYFRGRYVLAQATEETNEKATRYFQQAIEKDPGYPRPYSALAIVYAIWMPGANRPRDRMPKAREFALKALSLDNGVPEAHFALALVALLYDWDWTTADKEFQRELELNPNYFFAREWRARALVTGGKTEEAVAEAKRSLSLSRVVVDWDMAVWIFILARRYDLARELAQKEVDLEPNFPWGHFNLAQVYEQEGRAEDVAREFMRADELLGTDPRELEKLKRTMAKDGAKGYWMRKVENYKESAKSGYAPPVLTAMACVRLGDKQCAFEWLEKGFQERDDLMINLKAEPVFDGLQEDQRFQDLVRRVGIP